MSSEETTPETSTETAGGPIEPTTVEPEPDPEPEPTPDPVPEPTTPVTFQPGMWYSATAVCKTVGCPNQNTVMDVAELYSNNGTNVVINCGLCSKPATILSATLLDPQPDYS